MANSSNLPKFFSRSFSSALTPYFFSIFFLKYDSISCTIIKQHKHFLLVMSRATVSKIYNIYSNSTTGTSIFAGFSCSVKIKKQSILCISGPWDISKRIPRAISVRMALVSSIFVDSHTILVQNKIPRALNTVSLVRISSRPGGMSHRFSLVPV